MANYTNFYENLEEARIRLKDTVIMYDDYPYYVLAITDHKNDGIFRMYLDPLVCQGVMEFQEKSVPYIWHDDPDMSKGDKMDEYLSKNSSSTRIIRKMMNSPKFNKFKPFPLGMCNYGTEAFYTQRIPKRPLTQQGLIDSMVRSQMVTLDYGNGLRKSSSGPPLLSRELCATILGKYPTAEEVVENLKDPDVSNSAVAFCRDFAIVRGPLNMMFVAYKDNVVGHLPENDLSCLALGKGFSYVKEAAEELGVFESVKVL